MATPTESPLTSALTDTVADVGSLLSGLALRLSKVDEPMKKILTELYSQVKHIFGVLFSLHMLVKRYEQEGQPAAGGSGPYVVLSQCRRLVLNTKRHINDLDASGVSEASGRLDSCLSILSLACDRADTLDGVHSGLLPSRQLHSAGDNDETNDFHPRSPGANSLALESLYDVAADHEPRHGFRAEESPETVPSDKTILEWLRELNSPSYHRPPLELYPELCLVEVRNQRRPLYGIAAAEWTKYADSKWPVIKNEAEKLFTPGQKNNFIQWVLEFSRLRFPEQLKCAGHEDTASNIIELTNELEWGRLTPLHLASMLGLAELCKSLLAHGSVVGASSRFGCPLSCALVGPEILVQHHNPLSWRELATLMEPANTETIRALISYASDDSSRLNIIHDLSSEVTVVSLGFLASVQRKSPDIFDEIMKAGGKINFKFASMLNNFIGDDFPLDSWEVIVSLFSIALGYLFVRDPDIYPWDFEDETGSAIFEIMEQNDLSLPSSIKLNVPLIDDEYFGLAVRNCIRNGDHVYFQRLAMDSRFDPDLLANDSALDNSTITHMAVSSGQFEIIGILSSLGANFNAVDSQGRTPLMVVEDPTILDFLVHLPTVTTTSRDNKGRNIWHYAAATNDADLMEWLCATDVFKELNINTISEDHRTPILEALSYITTLKDERRTHPRKRPLVAYQLLRQAHLDCELGKSQPGIGCLAVEWGELDLVNMLVDKGVDFATVDDEGRSTLHYLNTSAEPKLVERLLELCDGLPTKSKNGTLPFESLYMNSFPIYEAGLESFAVSNHPSCFSSVTEDVLRLLLPPETLSNQKSVDEEYWDRFGALCVSLFERYHYMIRGGIPQVFEPSFVNGLMYLLEHKCLEAYEETVGEAGIWAFSVDLDDGTIFWSLKANPLIEHVLEASSSNGKGLLEDFCQTEAAKQLLIEALDLKRLEIVHLLADMVPLYEPSTSNGGITILEHALELGDEEFDSFLALLGHLDAEQLNSEPPHYWISFIGSSPDRAAAKLYKLLQHGLNPNTEWIGEPTHGSLTILSKAILQGASETSFLILAKGADPGFGLTFNAIAAAIESHNVDILEILLEMLRDDFDWSFPIEYKGKHGYNAIDFAVHVQSSKSLEVLFRRSNIRSIIHERSLINKGTPAHYATLMGDIDTLKILHQNGADFARVDDRGQTPLHVAAGKSYSEVTEFLSALCPLEAKDHDGLTAGDIAERRLADDGRAYMENTSAASDKVETEVEDEDDDEDGDESEESESESEKILWL